MYEVIQRQNGIKQLVDGNRLYEIIQLEDLLSDTLQDTLFVKETDNGYKLALGDKFYSFQKLPLFTSREEAYLRHRENAAYFIYSYKKKKFYIGSSGAVSRRVMRHRILLSSNHHFNKSLSDLYAEDKNLQIIIVKCQSVEEATDLEKQLIQQYKEDDRILNVLSVHSTWSKERKEAVAEKYKAKWRDPEYRAAQAKRLRERHDDPERKEAFRAKLKAFYADPVNNAKHAEGIRSRLLDPVFRENYDRKLRAKIWDNPEAKAKRAEGLRRFYADPEAKERRRIKAAETSRTPESIEKRRLSLLKAHADGSVGRATSERLKKRFSDPAIREQTFLKNKHLANPVSICGVTYRSMHQASNELGIASPVLKYRAESSKEKYKDYFYLNKDAS